MRKPAGRRAAARAAQASLRTVCDRAGAGLVQVDAAGRFIFANPAWCAMLGYSEAELLRMSVAEVTAPESLAATLEVMAQLRSGRAELRVLEKTYRRRDGSLLAASSTVTAVRAADGSFEGLVVVVVDETAQRQLREQLLENRRLLSLALHGARAGAWEYDLNAGESRWLQGMTELLGITDPAAADPAHWNRYLHPDDAARVTDSFTRLLRDGEPAWAAQYRIVRADGEQRWVSSRGAVLRSADGQAKVIGVDVDIHDQKLAEQLLMDADRRKDQFLATLAHELRNPLAPVISGLQLLGRVEPGPAADGLRAMMQRQLHHIVHLIDDLMDVSRIGSGKVRLKRSRFDLRGVVEDVVESLRVTEAQALPGHELVLALDPQPVWVEADDTRIAQVAGNLLSNAMKYTPAGGRIEVTVAAAGPAAVLRVADTGIGIPREMLDEVFEMFTQVERGTPRSQGGLGIGLALARSFVQMHGGTLEAESAGRNCGSTFTVRLPASGPPAAPAGAGAGAEGAPPAAPSVRVLVLDDNEDAAVTLGQLLTLAGHTVAIAFTGSQALRVAETFRPQLAIIDLGLPDMDGIEVAHRLRQIDGLAGCRLVALTGWGAHEHQARCQAAGFDEHITKPASPEQIEATVLRLGQQPAAPPG